MPQSYPSLSHVVGTHFFVVLHRGRVPVETALAHPAITPMTASPTDSTARTDRRHTISLAPTAHRVKRRPTEKADPAAAPYSAAPGATDTPPASGDSPGGGVVSAPSATGITMVNVVPGPGLRVHTRWCPPAFCTMLWLDGAGPAPCPASSSW